MKTIIEMAREAEFTDSEIARMGDNFIRFAELVRKDYSTTHANLWLDRMHKFMLAEREACAKLCEDAPEPDGKDLAERIRARGDADAQAQ